MLESTYVIRNQTHVTVIKLMCIMLHNRRKSQACVLNYMYRFYWQNRKSFDYTL